MIRKKNLLITLILLLTFIFSSSGSVLVSAADSKTAVKKQTLVLVKAYSNDFTIEMKYATCDNFVKKTLYPSPTCVLTKGTLDKLIKANNLVKKQGYSIKIWDAYRPLSVQKIMWEATPNKNYVANPYRSGSKHNRAAAVDVTLVDKNGKEVKMPTEFDNFTAKASPNYKGMTSEQRKNLDVLSKAMKSAGFKTVSHEWWHFEDKEYSNYKIQDIPLSKFDNTNYTLSNKTISNLKCIKSNDTSQQLIVVTSLLSNTSNVVINTYEKKKSGWVNIHKNITGYIGLKGFSKNKIEGDNKTPVGAFKIGTYYSKTSNLSTGLDFYKYASKAVKKNGIYDLFFIIEYNTAKIKNKDSASFFHIANAKAQIKYTNGCVATDKENLLAIVKWLDKDKNPLILQGPLSEVVKY